MWISWARFEEGTVFCCPLFWRHLEAIIVYILCTLGHFVASCVYNILLLYSSKGKKSSNGSWSPSSHYEEQPPLPMEPTLVLQQKEIKIVYYELSPYWVKCCFENLRGPALFWLIRKNLKLGCLVRPHSFKWKVTKIHMKDGEPLLTMQALVSFLSWSFLTTAKTSWMLASMNSSEDPFTCIRVWQNHESGLICHVHKPNHCHWQYFINTGKLFSMIAGVHPLPNHK